MSFAFADERVSKPLGSTMDEIFEVMELIEKVDGVTANLWSASLGRRQILRYADGVLSLACGDRIVVHNRAGGGYAFYKLRMAGKAQGNTSPRQLLNVRAKLIPGQRGTLGWDITPVGAAAKSTKRRVISEFLVAVDKKPKHAF